MWRDAAVMLAAGMGVPLLAALNAQLGVRIGSPAVAACRLDTLHRKPRAVAPVVRRREAVVEDEQKRPAAADERGFPSTPGVPACALSGFRGAGGP